MEEHDISGGVDLESRMNGSDAAPERRKVGRPRKVAATEAEAGPLGRPYSKFEAMSIIKDLTARIDAIREDNPEDEYARMHVDLRVELLQGMVDHLKQQISSQ